MRGTFATASRIIAVFWKPDPAAYLPLSSAEMSDMGQIGWSTRTTVPNLPCQPGPSQVPDAARTSDLTTIPIGTTECFYSAPERCREMLSNSPFHAHPAHCLPGIGYDANVSLLSSYA